MIRAGMPAVALRGTGLLPLLAILLCLPAAGCFVMGENHRTAGPVSGANAREIRDGATTRRQILERFGPPLAVARRGAVLALPYPGPVPKGCRSVSSDSFLEPFSAVRPPGPADAVYYYEATDVRATGALAIPIVGGGFYSRELVTRRLWVLVDESAGIVEGHVFLDAK